MNAGTVIKVAEEVAPTLIETGLFMLSFDHGVIGGLMNPAFSYLGVTAAALDAVADDGSTPYTLP